MSLPSSISSLLPSSRDRPWELPPGIMHFPHFADSLSRAIGASAAGPRGDELYATFEIHALGAGSIAYVETRDAWTAHIASSVPNQHPSLSLLFVQEGELIIEDAEIRYRAGPADVVVFERR